MSASEQAPNPDIEKAGSKDDPSSLIHTVTELEGETIEEQVEKLIESHGVLIFSKTFCPFCIDVKEFLTSRMGVPVYSLEVNEHPDGNAIHKYIKTTTNHSTVPAVYIKGSFVGGCDDVKALHAKHDLDEMIGDLVVKQRVTGAHRLESARFVPNDRGEARNPPFWFPNTVDNHVVRIVGVEMTALSILSIIFRNELWGKYLSVGMLVSFCLQTLVGSSLSPTGVIALALAAPFEPQFKPGPAKQFAASIGVMFTLISTCCYFTDNTTAGAVVLGMLACAAALEGFGGFCIACEFFMLGIQHGFVSKNVYRIYTSTLQELQDTWRYMYKNSHAPRPQRVDTDPSNKIALKYKKKTDEWTKDDFNLIRNMKPCYFAIPLSISGLATAFKIASDWGDIFRRNQDETTIIAQSAWYYTFSWIAAVLYFLLMVLFIVRLVLYPKKVRKEWECPKRSPSFGAITITLMIFAFLVYDEFNTEKTEEFARVLFWMGSVTHTLLTIAKFAEWVGVRLELEHVYPQWIIMPVGLAVASMVGSIVPMFKVSESNEDLHQEANALMGRFFLSFAYLMWIVLFTITFFKVVTGHNSDPRVRHGVSVWLAAPCVIGLSEFAVCANEAALGIGDYAICEKNFSSYYFIGMFFIICFLWMSFPYIGFVGRDKFNKGYWMDCFCIDTLAACSALFYVLNNYRASRTLMVMGLSIAGIANMVAFLHTVVALIHRRTFFTPMAKWGPLSFMKLTHEAFRGAIVKLERTLQGIDLSKPSGQQQLEMFSALYNQFVVVHVEHAHHEDKVIFKEFNDWFPDHGTVYTEDHESDKSQMEKLRVATNMLLDLEKSKPERETVLQDLKEEFSSFFTQFLAHIRGEEDDLQPIGRKYLPLELQKQLARESFKVTPADRWEIVIPYVVNNLPRHLQRVRYLKSLCWSMPERSQQIGAIVYRNVDAVMWERLRIEIPEIIPRGECNWRRYY